MKTVSLRIYLNFLQNAVDILALSELINNSCTWPDFRTYLILLIMRSRLQSLQSLYMTLVRVLNNETKTITESTSAGAMVTVLKYVDIVYSECNNKIRAHEGQKSLYLILSCEFLFYFSYFIVLKLYIAILSSSFVLHPCFNPQPIQRIL